MSSALKLNSTTKAIIGIDSALTLIEQKERVESACCSGDTSLILDTSKALLETIFKTILHDRTSGIDLDQDMNPLFRIVKDNLIFNRDSDADVILKKIGSALVHHIAELRNRYGAASHGNDGYYENPIELPEAEMIAQMTDALSGLLITKHRQSTDPALANRIYYNDYPEFNDFVDEQWGGFTMDIGSEQRIIISSSKILFDSDEKAYREMLLQYLSTEGEEEEDNE